MPSSDQFNGEYDLQSAPVIAVVRLTPRFVWIMAGDATAVLSVGSLSFSLPRAMRAAIIWWKCRKQFPVRMVAVPEARKQSS